MIWPAAAIRRRVIVRGFLAAGAVSPETAKTCREAGVVEGLGVRLGQLVRRGVLVSCGGGRYYVDGADRIRIGMEGNRGSDSKGKRTA